MVNEGIKLFMSPQQEKSVRKIIKGMQKNLELFGTLSRPCESNLLRIEKLVSDNMFFIVNSMMDNDKVDELTSLAEEELITCLFFDVNFLRVLAKNSLTNRIEKACINKVFPKSLAYRIRECAVAYMLYLSFDEDDWSDNALSGIRNMYAKIDCKKYVDDTQHMIKYAALSATVNCNLEFLCFGLTHEYKYDALKIIAQVEVFAKYFNNRGFLHYMTTRSLTNRIIKSCDEQNIPVELIYRIRECAAKYIKA